MFINNKSIRGFISDFLLLIEGKKGNAEDNLRCLEFCLDCLAIAYSSGVLDNLKTDESNYPDPPTQDPQYFQRLATERFPRFGFYNVPEHIIDQISNTQINVGDALDDIADIAKDLCEVTWRWDNTSEADALWHFKFLYESHWGAHLRNLQLYIHTLKNN